MDPAKLRQALAAALEAIDDTPAAPPEPRPYLPPQNYPPNADGKRWCKGCSSTRGMLPFAAFRAGDGGGFRRMCWECEKAAKREARRGEPGAEVLPTVPPATIYTEPSPFSGKARIAAEYRERVEAEARKASLSSCAAADLGVQTWVVVSDVHVPFEDRHCTAAVTALCEDIAPTGLIIAGDFLDFYEIAVHNAGSVAKLEGHRVTDTYRAANALLDEWRWCTDYLDGNHEGRLEDWLRAGDNAAWLGDEAVNIAHRLRFAKRGITHHVGEHTGKRLGRLVVTHGRWVNKYHANKHLDEYRHSVLYGHTHSPQTITTSAYGQQQIAVGLGHLADPDSPAMSYAPRPNRWCQGFALVHVYPDETFRVVPINFWQQSFVYGGKHYGRRPVVAVP